MFSNKVVKSSIVAAAIVLGSLAQPAFAGPRDSMPPAAGGGYHESAAFSVWMAAVRNLRSLCGFAQ